MKLKPLYDRVIIKPQEEEEVSANGIILPSLSDETLTILVKT